MWINEFYVGVVVGIFQGFGKVRKQPHGKLLVKCSSQSGNPSSSQNAVRVGVLGASGYTGSEVSYMAHNGSKCAFLVWHAEWLEDGELVERTE